MSGNSANRSDGVLLRVQGLSRAFLGIKAVSDLSFDVRTGTITGIVGPNGSGKSTTIDCISGFQNADEGKWFLGDRELTGLSSFEIARAGLLRTFQATQAYERLSVIENLLQAKQAFDGVGWLAALARSRRCRQAEREGLDRAREALELVGLERYAEAPTEVLSYGQRKLLAMAAVLMSKPRMVMLDEPVAGVNPTMIRRVEKIVRRMNDHGVSLLIVEHNMDFINTLCSRVIVLDAGRVLADGTPAEIRRDRRVLEAYLGKDEGTEAHG